VDNATCGVRGICLSMIVRNEAAVIERLLCSVQPITDYFVICDTGSSDGTAALIRRVAGTLGMAGEVHQHPWVDFAHNRQRALECALASNRCGWLLFIDADEELIGELPQLRTRLSPGTSYLLDKRHGGLRYAVPALVDCRAARWAWRGPVHEHLEQLSGPRRWQRCRGVEIRSHPDQGGRSRAVAPREKYLRDAALLEAELARNPDDRRSCFYLAQSYRDAGCLAKAYAQYRRRAAMGGWEEEVFMACYEQARLAARLNLGHERIVAEHLRAYARRPSRAEPLWHLARYCRQQGHYTLGYALAKAGAGLPEPDDLLFIHSDVYAWRLRQEMAVCAFQLGQMEETLRIARAILAEQRCRDADRTLLQTLIKAATIRLAAGSR
jgi:glycosyltransferase involved in cell wall biosynthesis